MYVLELVYCKRHAVLCNWNFFAPPVNQVNNLIFNAAWNFVNSHFTRSFRKISFVIGSLLTVASCVITAWISWSYNYVPSLSNQYNMLNILYDPPWTRIGPYMVGMLTGYYVIKIRGQLPLKTVSRKKIIGDSFLTFSKYLCSGKWRAAGCSDRCATWLYCLALPIEIFPQSSQPFTLALAGRSGELVSRG